MATIDYNDDKTKYFTRITEYEYLRPTPGSSMNRNPTGFFNLPLPENMPEDQYAAGLRDIDLWEIGSSVDVIKNGFSGASTFEQVASGAVGGAAAAAIFATISKKSRLVTDAIEKIPGTAVLGASALNVAGAYTGLARNPHTAMIFDRMNMRGFTLGFKLSPRNQAQSERLNSILNALKLGMHPTYNSTARGFALDYPKLYRVEFAGLEHEGIPKIDFSFLGNMTVGSAPQGQTFYRDGYPTFIDLKLHFSEIDMKTQESFTGGRIPNGNTPRGSERF